MLFFERTTGPSTTFALYYIRISEVVFIYFSVSTELRISWLEKLLLNVQIFSTFRNIPIGNSLYINIPTCACKGIPNAEITKLEHVVLTVSFVHKRRGQVSIDLFSPADTRSQMLSTRKYDDSDEGLDEWNFMTVHKWGEFRNFDL